jgi:hypothetical protein
LLVVAFWTLEGPGQGMRPSSAVTSRSVPVVNVTQLTLSGVVDLWVESRWGMSMAGSGK